MTKIQNSKHFSTLGFRILNLFRISNLEFRISPKGFTLVELLIATGLFAILSVSVIGVTLQATRAYLRAANRQAQLDNIRFGLDLLAREMRTGVDFTAPFYCDDAVGPGIEFTNLTADGRRFYYVANAVPDTCSPPGCGDTIKRIALPNPDPDNAPPPINPTSDCPKAVKFMGGFEGTFVPRFFFGLHGIAPGWTDGQPWITINLILVVPDPYVGSITTTIQTTITPRVRDF